ncbi:MAG: insulinase family protein [Anaerolineales bacterium]|nr:insulinase family protein [Anaerolineales bacterium]
MTEPVTRTTLANGLLVLLKEIHTAPLISSWVWYRVGVRDEPTGRTGISHWVEHMQFKGTPEFPPSVLDRAISRDGGIWNALTYLDWTTYFETMPADRIDLALRLEADRMVNCLYDPQEIESERTVVISEREGSENEPLFRLSEDVQHASFRVHPYQHETIGDMADLRSLQRDDLYDHYRTFYVPNNAVMAVAGDFESEALLARIRELYEPIPAGDQPPRLLRPEPEPRGERRLTVEGPGETTFIQVSYRAPAAAAPDFFPLSVLDSLLTGPTSLNMFGGGGVSNKTSRLYQALVEKELAVSVGGSLLPTADPFLYTVTITVHPLRKPEEALEALDAEIRRLQEEPVSSDEIRRAIKQARALFAYGSESITNQAFWLGNAEMFASYDWFLTYLDHLARVTPARVQKAARKLLLPRNRVVGIYLPHQEGGA